MRHLKSGRQLGRNSSHRKAMFRNMVVSLIEHESITTTDAKAKELRRHAEKVITLGKRGTLASRRMARVMVNDRAVLQKLFSTIAERYKDRPGGYTRIVKLGVRPGDSAPMSVIQLVQEEMKAETKKPAAKKSPKKESIKAKETKDQPEEVVNQEVQAEAETEVDIAEVKSEAEEITEEKAEAETPADTEAEEEK